MNCLRSIDNSFLCHLDALSGSIIEIITNSAASDLGGFEIGGLLPFAKRRSAQG